MQKVTCSIQDCAKPSRARGWCWMHYQQWRRTGSTHIPNNVDKFWARVNRDGSCWEWTGEVAPDGYGKFNVAGTSVYAHRFSYTLATGNDPQELDVDHACHNRACVNPEHLRVTTRKQNAEHRLGAQRNSKTGIRGVYFDNSRQGFLGVVGHHGKRITVGRFDTPEEAGEAVKAKRLELFTHNDADRKAG